MRCISSFIALAVTAVIVGGCGSSPSASTSGDSGIATGTFEDWVATVCQAGSYERTISNPVIMCNGDLAESGGFRSQIMVFEYLSQSDMQADRKMWDGEFGYATCIADDRIGVFKAEVSGIGSRAAAADLAERSLQPLAEYGCSLRPSGSSSQPVLEAPTQNPASPAPSAPSASPGGVELPAGASGYVTVQTRSGRTRCQIESSRVICETAKGNWPAHGVEITADGSTRFADGNLGDIRPVTMQYQSYQAIGWTIVASSSGTRFTNDRTGHGAVVSVERVQAF